MAEPPLFAGGVNVTVACVFPAVAVPIVGAPGTVGDPPEVVNDSSFPYAVPALFIAYALT